MITSKQNPSLLTHARVSIDEGTFECDAICDECYVRDTLPCPPPVVHVEGDDVEFHIDLEEDDDLPW